MITPYLKQADLVIFVIDAERPVEEQSFRDVMQIFKERVDIFARCENQPRFLLCMTKADRLAEEQLLKNMSCYLDVFEVPEPYRVLPRSLSCPTLTASRNQIVFPLNAKDTLSVRATTPRAKVLDFLLEWGGRGRRQEFNSMTDAELLEEAKHHTKKAFKESGINGLGEKLSGMLTSLVSEKRQAAKLYHVCTDFFDVLTPGLIQVVNACDLFGSRDNIEQELNHIKQALVGYIKHEHEAGKCLVLTAS